MLAFPPPSIYEHVRVPNSASHYLTGFLEAHIEIVLGYGKMSLCPSPSKVSVPPPSKVSVPHSSKVSVPPPSKVSVPLLVKLVSPILVKLVSPNLV